MTQIQFSVFVGLAIGAVWAFAGFGSAVLVSVLALLGLLVGLVLQGRLDLTDYLGHRSGPR